MERDKRLSSFDKLFSEASQYPFLSTHPYNLAVSVVEYLPEYLERTEENPDTRRINDMKKAIRERRYARTINLANEACGQEESLPERLLPAIAAEFALKEIMERLEKYGKA